MPSGYESDMSWPHRERAGMLCVWNPSKPGPKYTLYNKSATIKYCTFLSSVGHSNELLKPMYVQCLVTQSCPTLCDPTDCGLSGSSVHGDSPGKNTGVGCHALLQGIFPTKGSNPGLPHRRQIFHHLSHQGSSTEASGNLQICRQPVRTADVLRTGNICS